MNESERRVSSGEAWAEFCDALKQAGEQIQRPEAPGSIHPRRGLSLPEPARTRGAEVVPRVQ